MKPSQHLAGIIQEALDSPETDNVLRKHFEDGGKMFIEHEQVSIGGFPNEGGRIVIKNEEGITLYWIDVYQQY